MKFLAFEFVAKFSAPPSLPPQTMVRMFNAHEILSQDNSWLLRDRN